MSMRFKQWDYGENDIVISRVVMSRVVMIRVVMSRDGISYYLM